MKEMKTMRPPVKVCPLLGRECLEDRCMWYIAYSVCALKAIAESQSSINKVLSTARVLYPGE
jgi:hypothetical protein